MTINLKRLTNIGFEPAGRWLLAEHGLNVVLHDTVAQQSHVLYAFAVNGALAYVGKTTLTLRERMQRYKTPPRSGRNGGSTNIKNNRNIAAALLAGQAVEIFVLRAQHQAQHGEFLVSLAARLEDNLIGQLAPPWNGRPRTDASGGIKQESTAVTAHRLFEETLNDYSKPLTIPILNGNPMRQVTIKHTQQTKTEPKLSKADFQLALQKVLADAASVGDTSIEVRSGSLHTSVGVYPKPGHSMPTCCSVMYEEMKPGDVLIGAPPKGKGANVLIRYKLPRR